MISAEDTGIILKLIFIKVILNITNYLVNTNQ